MISPQKYSTAKAFRVALEARLKQIANNEHIDLQRLRRLVAFDRLLARIFQSQEKRWILKGGYATGETLAHNSVKQTTGSEVA